MLNSFKNLIKKCLPTKKEAKSVLNDLFLVIMNKDLNEEQMLKEIEKKQIFKTLSIQKINHEVVMHDDYKVNALMYCLLNNKYQIAAKMIDLEGVIIDENIKDVTALEIATKYLFKPNSQIFFNTLFSKKRSYKGNIYYPPLVYVMLHSPNEEFTLNFISTFDVDLTKKEFIDGDALDYLQEREELTKDRLKSILNTNQFSKQRLEEALNTETNLYEMSTFRSIIKEKLIEMEKNELDAKLDNSFNSKTKSNKIKI
jgi:hypothetical protein